MKSFLFCLVLFLTVISQGYSFDEFILMSDDLADHDQFGYAVDIDGDYAVIGAMTEDPGGLENAGSAYIFHWDGNSWTQQAKIIPDDHEEYISFGNSVAISGDLVVVSTRFADIGDSANAGAAYLFQRDGDDWNQIEKLIASDVRWGHQFGYSVDIEGDYIVAGCMQYNLEEANRAGAVYVFHFNGQDWVEEAILFNDDPEEHEYLGYSVKISGNTIISCAPGDDMGGDSEAKVIVFEKDGQDWAEVQELFMGDGDMMGMGESIGIDGDRIAIPASRQFIISGAVFTFERDNDSWVAGDTLIPGDIEGSWGNFGYSVALNGNRIAGGDIRNSPDGISNAGAAYLYTNTNDMWQETEKLVASDASEHDWNGYSINLSDEWMIVGAKNADHGEIDGGKVYIYHLAEPVTVTLEIPNGGEELIEGNQVTIEWAAEPAENIVQSIIEYSTDNGANWTPIGTTEDDDFDIVWNVPGVFTLEGLIKVTVETAEDEATDESDAVFTIIPIPDVTLTTLNGGGHYNTGDEVTIEWGVSTDPDITGNVIEYSTDGGDTWNYIGATQNEDFEIVWTIPDLYSLYTVVRVRSTDEYDIEGYDISDDWFILTPVSASYTFLRGWTFFSLPYLPNDNSVGALIEARIIDDMPWDLFAFDMSTSYYRPEELFVGNGYMLTMFQDELEMSFDCNAGTEQVDWELDFGWNLIGVPFGQPLTVANQTVTHEGNPYSIATAADAYLCVPIFYSWSAVDSAYLIANTLDVWESYYFVALDTMDLNLFPAPPGPVPTASDDVPGTFDAWELTITATMDGKSDRLTTIGANVNATDGFDPVYDYPEPPNGNICQVVNTYFHEEDWLPDLSQNFCRDIREQMVEEEDSWTMQISTIRPGDVTLTWDEIFNTTPAGYEFEVCNPSSEQSIDPRAVDSYTFYNEDVTEITIRALASLDVESGNSLPNTLELLSAYPNPFNPTLNIKLNLQNASDVTLNIIDLNGKLVSTLLNSSVEAGSHDLTWNAQSMPNGVYLLNLETGNSTTTQKVLLMK